MSGAGRDVMIIWCNNINYINMINIHAADPALRMAHYPRTWTNISRMADCCLRSVHNQGIMSPGFCMKVWDIERQTGVW